MVEIKFEEIIIAIETSRQAKKELDSSNKKTRLDLADGWDIEVISNLLTIA